MTDCALVMRAFYSRKAVDQLQMHLRGRVDFSATPSPSASDGLLGMESGDAHRIVATYFKHTGNDIALAGITPIHDTGYAPHPRHRQACRHRYLHGYELFGQNVLTNAVDTMQVVAVEKEASITFTSWEYRMKWLGEDEQTARRHAAEIGASEGSGR